MKKQEYVLANDLNIGLKKKRLGFFLSYFEFGGQLFCRSMCGGLEVLILWYISHTDRSVFLLICLDVFVLSCMMIAVILGSSSIDS